MWIGVLDQDDSKIRLAPLGATGELLIEGPILAREYIGRPDLSAAHFVSVPWLSPDRRVYRTGDLAFLDAQGHFHFRGRREDGQVKINGQRVELGELSASLTSTRSDILQAAVVTFERQTTTDLPSHQVIQLAAFVVFADTITTLGLDKVPSPIPMSGDLRQRLLDIKRHLQRLLPKYMIPSVFLPMSALPKTRTLKTDRKALTSMVESLTDTDFQRLTLSSESDDLASTVYKAPRNALESKLLQHWTKALGLSESVAHGGVDGNFFDLGGDSISAMHFIWLARGDALHLSVTDVHTHPSVSEMADLLNARKSETPSSHEADELPMPFSLISREEKHSVMEEMRELGIGADDIEDIYHATATQVGLIFETEKHKNMWVSKDVLEFSADLDVDRLRVAWERLVEHNAIFRTRIVHAAADGAVAQAYQVVLRHGEAKKVWDDGSRDSVFGFGHPLSVHRLRDNHFEWIRHHSLCKS